VRVIEDETKRGSSGGARRWASEPDFDRARPRFYGVSGGFLNLADEREARWLAPRGISARPVSVSGVCLCRFPIQSSSSQHPFSLAMYTKGSADTCWGLGPLELQCLS